MYSLTSTGRSALLSGLSDFDDAITIVWKRVNYNTGSPECRSTNACYPKDRVARILQVYNGAVKDGTCPIYAPANGSQVCGIIQSMTGIEKGVICAVLAELYNATISDSLDSREYLAPQSGKTSMTPAEQQAAMKAKTAQQQAASSDPNVRETPVSSWYKNPWILGAIVTSIGGIGLYLKSKRMKKSKGLQDDTSSGHGQLTYDVSDEHITVRTASGNIVRFIGREEAEADGIWSSSPSRINFMVLRSWLVRNKLLKGNGKLRKATAGGQ